MICNEPILAVGLGRNLSLVEAFKTVNEPKQIISISGGL